MKQLIDVSEFQGSIDWKKVRGKVDGAFVRVADGDHKDPTYNATRVKEIRAAKLPWGPYYFARVASPANGQRSGAQEAKMAIDLAKAGGWPRAGDLPLMYDFEDLNGQPVAKVAKHLADFVRAYRKEMGHLPIFYTYPSIWPPVERELKPKDRALLSHCPLWIAEYGVSHPTVPAPWKSYSIWQDSSKWRCPGISGNVDHDQAAVPLSKLTIRGQAGPKPVAPPIVGPETPKAPAKPVGKKGKKPKAKVAASAVKRPAGIPAWLPKEHWGRWQKPWSKSARESTSFKKVLLAHGFMSPNFTLDETRCHDPARTPVPKNLVAGAQRHAFNNEILRHELGDKSLPVLSWYRTPAWNVHEGGASGSRHMQADATDFEVAVVQGFGPGVFDRAGEKIFARGGFGTYPSGSRHTDSRGSRARWSSF
jgi:lysozyme